MSNTLSERIDITKDGKIWKQIETKGTGKRVEVGDILAIEYTAKVVGSNKPFAKGDKEKFVFKDGTMIRGWDIAVGSMKIGEKAKLVIKSEYAYGSNGIKPVIPPDSDIEKDLDIDPFIASTPEDIQAEFDNRQASMTDKYKGNIFEIYLNRIKNISFGFGGSNFFASQSGERPPWYLNPNITFPTMIAITLAAFITVLATGSFTAGFA
eukprot:gene19303-25164_t